MLSLEDMERCYPEVTRPGAPKAVAELYRQLMLRDRGMRSAAPRLPTKINDVCPSISKLEEALLDRDMSDLDVQLAYTICCELAENTKYLDQLVISTSTNPGFADRLLLYEGQKFDVRVNLFMSEIDESRLSIIHDHKQRFISSCIQGSYVHKLHAVRNMEGGRYFTMRRGTKSIESSGVVETEGAVDLVCSQPFEAGQTLFLSVYAYHTVHPDPNNTERTATITFRCITQERCGMSYLVDDPSARFDFPEVIEHERRSPESQRIVADFKAALLGFHSKLRAAHTPPEESFTAMVDGISQLSQAVEGVGNEIRVVAENITGLSLESRLRERERVIDIFKAAFLVHVSRAFQNQPLPLAYLNGCCSRLQWDPPEIYQPEHVMDWLRERLYPSMTSIDRQTFQHIFYLYHLVKLTEEVDEAALMSTYLRVISVDANNRIRLSIPEWPVPNNVARGPELLSALLSFRDFNRVFMMDQFDFLS